MKPPSPNQSESENPDNQPKTQRQNFWQQMLGKSENPDSQSEPPKPQHFWRELLERNSQSEIPKSLYFWQEAFRVSELRLEKQDHVFITLERKATLLVTLYVAIIAYLLSWDMLWDKYPITMTILIGAWIIAAGLGMSVLFISKFGIAGANPNNLMDEDFEGDFNNFAKDLLRRYGKRYKTNEGTNDRKRNRLQRSLLSGIISFVFSLAVLACNTLNSSPAAHCCITYYSQTGYHFHQEACLHFSPQFQILHDHHPHQCCQFYPQFHHHHRHDHHQSQIGANCHPLSHH